MPKIAETLPVTSLDKALLVARQNAVEANYFYDAFLNTDLYMPVQIADAKEALGRPVGWDEKFHPFYLPYGDIKVVPLFDQWERLKEWSQEKAPDYLYLRCHVLLKLLSPTTAAILNIGTPWNHFFPIEVLDRLRKSMQTILPS